ncbi:3-isopropylmalate dehydrogenase [Selenomonas ruminantium subsp. lactilytica TAM6421]|uniref:3-isopropylmalate dehydrogenase n=2 Tax=Selenomonas ruminantium TaxID=971 RepID=Q845Z7_SELRU|nr:3-isopropylmalate dehydrogenase [Selenomonas ruminantium]BAC57936.1 3-isopropylmalate dehydrogenase [Selenomonas ruminantium subsp. lactilytica]BAL83350.1 3-isopropylmalate dehydrogenase [Selenomonas ruminantium subsp. lactilytica TAM6421]
MAYKITVIPGDGIGQEITDSAVEVLKAADKKFNLGLEFDYHDAGGTAYDKFGTPLPQETIDACKAADGVLFGAVGGDKWDKVDPAKRPEKAILGLRKALGLYANLRPVKVADALVEYSPLKPELVKGVDLVIVRELIGGIYFGEKCESEQHNGAERAWDLENYSVPEVERIANLAFETAKLRRGKVTSVDKSNVLATSRLWRRTVAKVAENYPEVECNNLYVDNCAMQIAVNPTQFDVIVTGNLFGDILSDEAAVVGGSIGMLPSASIGECTSLYEPIHGSAPDIAGQGIANPIGTILSAAMLLRYSLHEEAAADAIEAAVDKALGEGYRTPDLWKEGFTKVNTSEITKIISERV